MIWSSFFKLSSLKNRPAIVRGHLDVDALEVAADGLAEVLAQDADHRPDQEDDCAAFVEKFEEPIVNRRLVKFKVFGNVSY